MLYQKSWMESLNNYLEKQEKKEEEEKSSQPMTDYFNKMLPEEITEIAQKSARRVMRRHFRR